MSCIGRGLNRIYLSTYEGCLAVTYGRGRDYRKVCALIFLFSKIMKKSLLLILLSIYSFTTIHAKITWTLSDDGTLTISGTDMPDYSLINNAPWDLQKYKIKKVVIKDGVTSIGSEAFFYCTGLTSVSIPNSVTSIGNSAFNYCSSLTTITIPESVTSIGSSAFYRTKWYDNQPDGVVYAGKVLYEYKGTMPSNTKIDIKEGTTQIGGYAFSDCSDLTSITIPNSVTSIGESAFENCSSLTSVTIPNSVTKIEERAFYGCESLTSVTIPNSVTSIGNSAFKGCSGIKEIYSWNPTPPQAYSNSSFENMNIQHAKLFVPEGAGDAYKYSPYWREFLNIYEMEYTPVLSAADPITISDSKPSVTKGYYKEKTVTYVREGAAISKENYASFCLPFAVDPADAQFKAIYVPVGLSLYNTEANTLRIGFYQTDDIIPAGTPFLAQLAVADKVEIKNALPVNYAPNAPAVKTSVVRTFNHSNSAGIMNENNDYAISFSGSYNKVSPANGYTFNTDGSIGASANVVPFRAYFVIGKNASNAKIITSFDIDAETTGIGQLRMTNNELPVYDMNGRRVNEKSLKSGIYIKNGKKYVK